MYVWVRAFDKEESSMKDIRRKEKTIKDNEEMKAILKHAKYVTIAMCREKEPYLVTINHGYDPDRNVIYFHCAKEGKKIDILKANNTIWGEALLDEGYVTGKCDHLYRTVHFNGTVTFVEETEEKRHALITMIQQLEPNPERVIKKQITEESIEKVNIGKIDIKYMTGKKSL
jgi:nitroimidazol reductase NimA-like FMN-containing flavoprotein (pyridoxamine 5'-phosphate oxidase superfamily)